MKKLLEAIAFFKTKQTFTQVEILSRLGNVRVDMDKEGIDLPNILPNIPPEPEPKKYKCTNVIKKYDVLYITTLGLAHYVLVYRVKNDHVTVVIMSSKEAPHNLMEVIEDRFFKGNYATKTILTYPLSECIGRFSRVYENKKEADEIFRRLKQHYKESLSL